MGKTKLTKKYPDKILLTSNETDQKSNQSKLIDLSEKPYKQKQKLKTEVEKY